MRTIFKYMVPVGQQIQVIMPKGSKIQHIAFLDSQVRFWAEVNPDLGLVERTFCIVGTGHPIPDSFNKYWGTALEEVNDITYVWHLYEIGFVQGR